MLSFDTTKTVDREIESLAARMVTYLSIRTRPIKDSQAMQEDERTSSSLPTRFGVSAYPIVTLVEPG